VAEVTVIFMLCLTGYNDDWLSPAGTDDDDDGDILCQLFV